MMNSVTGDAAGGGDGGRDERRAGRRRSRVGGAVGSVLTVALVLGGCSAGAVTQTDTTLSQASGAQGQIGGMLVRDLALEVDPTPDGQTPTVPAGGQVGVRGTLVNEAAGADQLLSVSSPYASTVRAEGQLAVPGGDKALRLLGSAPGPAGPPPRDSLATGSARVVLSGATQPIAPGPTYLLTLTFRAAGTLTLGVPLTSSQR